MSALAVERPPLFAGHALVRTPGSGALHIVVAGAEVPPHAVFHAPVECAPAGGPAVRRYDGPPDLARMCPACLTTVQGLPQPEPPAPPVLDHLPFELPAAVYAERPLPQIYSGHAIDWEPWHKALRITHCDPACDWCGDPESGLTTIGRQRARLARFFASRCTACERLDAYEQTGLADLQPIATHKGQGPRKKRA